MSRTRQTLTLSAPPTVARLLPAPPAQYSDSIIDLQLRPPSNRAALFLDGDPPWRSASSLQAARAPQTLAMPSQERFSGSQDRDLQERAAQEDFGRMNSVSTLL
jgi:hypothetical protein